jgi:hypothetical protein
VVEEHQWSIQTRPGILSRWGRSRMLLSCRRKALMMKRVIRLARTKLWKFADVELRDNTQVDASEFNYLDICSV